MKTKDNRIGWIDTARGLGLLLVIVGHMHLPYLSTWIYTFHIPLFFFISGTVFSGKKYGFKAYFVHKIKTIAVPYFCLGSVIFLFYCIVYALQGQPKAAYFEMLKAFLIQEHYWTVWFLACLFCVEIIYYAIFALVGRLRAVSTLISLALCAFGLIRYRLGWGSLPWNLDVALIAQFFFHCGFLLKDILNFEPKTCVSKRIGYFAIIAALLFVNVVAGFLGIKISGSGLDMSVGLYGNEVLTMISALAGILLAVLIAKILKSRILTFLGQNTMVIFAWHSRILIVFCQLIYTHFGIFQNEEDLVARLLYAAVTMTVIFVVLVPATVLLKKTKARRLFGLR